MLGRAPSWIPGRRNRWTLTLASRLMPLRQLIRIVGSNMRQWYGKQWKRAGDATGPPAAFRP